MGNLPYLLGVVVNSVSAHHLLYCYEVEVIYLAVQGVAIAEGYLISSRHLAMMLLPNDLMF